MSKRHLVFVLVFALMSSPWARAENLSVRIDAVSDCTVVSSSNEQAPIDFYESECKAFGGYRLKIKGSDLRYGPELSYSGTKIDLQRPLGFHDMASTTLEWLYDREVNNIGMGSLQWRGLIYALEISQEEVSIIQYYGVRLAGRKSCVVATSGDKDSVRQRLLDPQASCK